ncbi:MAG: hypothetical protein GY870_21520 [archaeon]|nr:hypothetical protein [archaeon]
MSIDKVCSQSDIAQWSVNKGDELIFEIEYSYKKEQDSSYTYDGYQSLKGRYLFRIEEINATTGELNYTQTFNGTQNTVETSGYEYKYLTTSTVIGSTYMYGILSSNYCPYISELISIDVMRETWENETLNFKNLYYNKTRDDEFSGQYDFSSNNNGYSWYVNGFINQSSTTNSTSEYSTEVLYGDDGILISLNAEFDSIQQTTYTSFPLNFVLSTTIYSGSYQIRRIIIESWVIVGVGISLGFTVIGVIGTIIIRKKRPGFSTSESFSALKDTLKSSGTNLSLNIGKKIEKEVSSAENLLNKRLYSTAYDILCIVGQNSKLKESPELVLKHNNLIQRCKTNMFFNVEKNKFSKMITDGNAEEAYHGLMNLLELKNELYYRESIDPSLISDIYDILKSIPN